MKNSKHNGHFRTHEGIELFDYASVKGVHFSPNDLLRLLIDFFESVDGGDFAGEASTSIFGSERAQLNGVFIEKGHGRRRDLVVGLDLASRRWREQLGLLFLGKLIFRGVPAGPMPINGRF